MKDKEKQNKLKPCPFCGRRPFVGKTKDELWHYVYCGNEDCGVNPKTKSFNKKEYAVEYWNRRVNEK